MTLPLPAKRNEKMKIQEAYHDLELTAQQQFLHISRNGAAEPAEGIGLLEHVIDVYINEVLTMKLICTAEHLAELVIGRMLSEGMIAKAQDITFIYVCEFGKRARVMLQNPAAPGSTAEHETDYVETTQTCCTGNHILTDYFITHREIQPLRPIPWNAEWVFQLADRFARGTKVHQATVSTHSCFLSHGEELLFQCEDIGRHNALDKAIGYALMRGIDLRQCILYSSGRVSTDMAIKAIRAKVPILASKSQATMEAVRLAQSYGLTLIAGARPDSMKLLAGMPPIKPA